MPREALDPRGALTREVKGGAGGELPLWKELFDASASKPDENGPRRRSVMT
jgi:hypothetical protein